MKKPIDGDAVEKFCRDRAEQMKSPLAAAIYTGLATRIARGYFDGEETGDVR